jgi:hypothetical protein
MEREKEREKRERERERTGQQEHSLLQQRVHHHINRACSDVSASGVFKALLRLY